MLLPDARPMNFRQKFVREFLFPLGDTIRRRSVAKAMDELEQSEWWQRDQLLELQGNRLHKLIEHAYNHVPYYRDLMRDHKLRPSDILSRQDIHKLPVLRREDIRRNYPDRLCADTVDLEERRVGRTGGSTTGEPLFFAFDRRTMDYGRAVLYRGGGWAGCHPGTATLTLWGQPVVRPTRSVALTKRLSELLFRTYWINAFRFDDNLLQQCALILQDGKVQAVSAYASAARELCQYLRTRHIKVRGIRAVMTTAEVLLPSVRDELEQTFGAPVFDGYGCGEVNGIAYECDSHTGLHVGMERAIVEIVDSQGQPVSEGGSGRIAVTDLHNKAMPLVRYLNGDEASIDLATCPCGRNLERLQHLLGRTCDIIDGVNGRHVHSYYFASLFGMLGWAETYGLTQFQVVQESTDSLCVTLVTCERPPATEMTRLLDNLTEFLGDMKFRIEYSDHLDMSGSGKLRWTINRLRTSGTHK